MKKKIFLMILIILGIIIPILLLTGNIAYFDNKVYELLTINANDTLTNIMYLISDTCSISVIVLLVVLIALKSNNNKVTYMTILNLFIIIILNFALKNIFLRERPIGIMDYHFDKYSFPSGHAMVSLGFYGYAIFLLSKEYLQSNKIIKKVLIPLLGILILFIGISRIYLGFHHFSDVLEGFILSGIYLMFFIPSSKLYIEGKIQKSEKLKRLTNSFKYAFQGIITAMRSERNMKIHILITLLVIIMGFILKISIIEWLICFILFAIVISFEIMNTAVEKVVDLVSPKYNELAGKAKDLAAGAVLFSAIIAAISGLIIFIPKIIEFFN